MTQEELIKIIANELTQSEKNILEMFLEDDTGRRSLIAKKNYLATGTIKTHICNIYKKTGITNLVKICLAYHVYKTTTERVPS